MILYRRRKRLEENDQPRCSHARNADGLYFIQDIPVINSVHIHSQDHFKAGDSNRTRLYLQDQDGSLIEKCYDGNRVWYTGGFKVTKAPPRTAIAATNFNANSSGVSIRVYYASGENRLLEKGWDGQGWYDGGLKQDTIPGPQAAVIEWGHGSQLNLRIYFQRGEFVSGVSEWAYSNGQWKQGRIAIPPA